MNQINADAISAQLANHTLHFYNSSEGFSGGFFSDRLFELMVHADSAKLNQLALGFPAEVAAFKLGKEITGLMMLRTIATKLHLVASE